MSDSSTGVMVPRRFVNNTASISDQNLASVLWGGTLGIGAWTASEAFVQSSKSWGRIRRVNAYVVFVWVEWWSCFVISLISWMQMRGYIAQSFEYWFFLVFLWSIQVQCLMQIITNRVALLMQVPTHATRLKWAVFLIVLLVCIGAFCTTIPAKMQISGTYLYVYNIWAHVKKGIILAVDAGLNVYFIYLVRSRLITAGLEKYWKLYWFNFYMVLFSITLDALTLALISLPNYVVYLQFHPLAYLIKLHIEMKMADLIGKIVNSSHPINVHGELPSRTRSTRQPNRISGLLGRVTGQRGNWGDDAHQAYARTRDVETGPQGQLCELQTSKVGIPHSVLTKFWKGSSCTYCGGYGDLETLATGAGPAVGDEWEIERRNILAFTSST